MSSVLTLKEISTDESQKVKITLINLNYCQKFKFKLMFADSLGRIMGEYGFITADNVYHVTVYATDENGNFKIISMKNIKLHQLPAHDTTKSIPSTTLQPFTVKTTAKPTTLTTTPAPRGESCAHCKLPPTKKPETETLRTTTTVVSNTEEISTIPPPFKIVTKDDTTIRPQTTTQLPQQQKLVVENKNQQLNQIPNGMQQNNFNNFQSGNFNQQPQQQQLQNSNNLLYRFDYGTDFQGHKEEGDHSGNKYGEYYSVGRDNVKRIVSYKANEFGFMPQIRQQPISLNELRQYDESNNKLRHYNFEWFYPTHPHFG